MLAFTLAQIFRIQVAANQLDDIRRESWCPAAGDTEGFEATLQVL